jgi:hypothetical protein
MCLKIVFHRLVDPAYPKPTVFTASVRSATLRSRVSGLFGTGFRERGGTAARAGRQRVFKAHVSLIGGSPRTRRVLDACA